MALSDWILNSGQVATATPATPATPTPLKRPTVATVATVAVASSEKRKVWPNHSMVLRIGFEL